MDKVLLIGNAHIDPVWLWTWREGLHEIKATFLSALDRMKETEGYIFTCACASYYEWVEENAPEMFEEIRQRVREGRWRIVGGMWVQPDMNSLSGESIARHLLVSQRYFSEKFGITVKTGYNVDTFGHNGQLPQILNLAGIVNYVWMRPMMKENAEIPEGALWWEGIDGSGVKAFRIPDCYTGEDIENKIEGMLRLANQTGLPMMCFYGVGNHGGGPTRRCLARIEARKEEYEADGIRYGHPDQYFEALEGRTLPVWRGELQHHASGCYSTHQPSKALLRRTENGLLSAEIFGEMAGRLAGFQADGAALARAWKKTLFNQFHDLLGGCSLRAALEDMLLDVGGALSDAMRVENAALQKLSWAIDTVNGNPALIRSKENDDFRWNVPGCGTPVVVFNPHAFEAEGEVQVFRECARVTDENGAPVPAQRVRAARTNGKDKWDTLFLAKVPPLGYRVYWMYLDGADERNGNYGLSATDTVLENRCLRVEIDPQTGEIARVYSKETGYEALKAPSRALLIDIEHADTWAHNLFAFEKVADTFGSAKVRLHELGSARAVIRAESFAGENVLTRDYVLTCDGRHVEVRAKVNMKSPHRLLKVCVSPNAESMRHAAEIPFGMLEREPNGNEEPCQRWIAGFDDNGGCAIVNTGAYAESAKDGEIRMTVLNTSAYADHFGQKERDEDMEYMALGETRFAYAVYPFEGALADSGVWQLAGLMNRPLKWIVDTYHEGALPLSNSGIGIAPKNILLPALKRSENGKGSVLRLYEACGKQTAAKIDLKLFGRQLSLDFRPYEIKTVFVPDDISEPAREIDIPEFQASGI